MRIRTKKYGIAFYLFLLPVMLCNFQEIDAKISADVQSTVKSYPNSFRNLQGLAFRINADFDTELEKASAIYTWIAHNICYDMRELRNRTPDKIRYRTLLEREFKIKALEEKRAEKTFKTRKGICSGYALLFKQLCELCGLQCVYISGTSKTTYADIGQLPKKYDHAWNAVKINNKWELIDVTWGSGEVDEANYTFVRQFNPHYFCTDPEHFFLEHYPEDEQWLLINKTRHEFAQLPLFFSNYFSAGIEIYSPMRGYISSEEGGKVTFRFSGANSPIKLYYAFDIDRYSMPILAREVGDYIEFDVEFKNRKAKTLTIYKQEGALVTYRVAVK